MPGILQGRDDSRLVSLFWWCGLRSPLVRVPVPAAATTITIPLTFSAGTAAYGVHVTPSWLTTVAVPVATRLLASVRVDFGTAAPAGATIDVTFSRADR